MRLPTPRVKVVAPEMRTFVEALTVQGTVRSKSCAAVSARVAGTIDELCVEEGSSVALGTPLFGMLPMALGSGLGSELRAAIGIGSVGGILVSSVVSLYFIPALCALRRPKEDENFDIIQTIKGDNK